MASRTEIANMALGHIGVGKKIANIDTETERSQEATACRQFYDIALAATLRDFAWPFATRIEELGLVEEDPNSEWSYSYRYPTNCVEMRRILSGTRTDTHQSRVPFRIIHDASGKLILTDQENAEAEYTILASDPLQYPPDFILAFSYRLATYIIPQITTGDQFTIGKGLLQLYMLEIRRAQTNAANEEQPDQEPDSEFDRIRG